MPNLLQLWRNYRTLVRKGFPGSDRVARNQGSSNPSAWLFFVQVAAPRSMHAACSDMLEIIECSNLSWHYARMQIVFHVQDHGSASYIKKTARWWVRLHHIPCPIWT